MKRKAAFESFVNQLKSEYDPKEAFAIARLVFNDLGIESFRILSDPGVFLSQEDFTRLEEIITRLLQGEPVQYVLGYAWFRERKFYVDPDCLIPRQETEELVELILEESKDQQQFIDIGTGSGCIGISLQSERNTWRADASDISLKTLQIASNNARLNLTSVKFIQDDILSPDYSKFPDNYDLVVSNPPYVMESERFGMHRNVLENEPGKALFVPDDDPLIYYSAIRQFCMKKLKPGGRLYLEINEALGSVTRDFFVNNGFYDITIIKDINNKDRFIKATRNE